MSPLRQADYLIIGAGIIGLATARALKNRFPAARVIVVEKEDHVAEHGSGRNSGVLHAGFYYTADSLKARFCRDGNRALTAYAQKHGLKYNHCRKVVVAKNEEERQTVHELKSRGDRNGVEVSVVDEKGLAKIEPEARTFKEALFSPTTGAIDPVEISNCLADELKAQGVEILLSHPYRGRTGEKKVRAGALEIEAEKIINCAGLYADRIARDFGFSKDYTIIPFKGIHLLSTKPTTMKALIYPVPNLKNPFLGVHFNVTVHGKLKLGPTAIPAFWRENYQGFDHFKLDELFAIAGWEMKLLATNAFNFRSLAVEELRKYSRKRLLDLARPMAQRLDDESFTEWARPGIRAQLLHKESLQLVQDFIVEAGGGSIHVLNAVSPAFTCSFAFTEWMVENYV